MGNETSSSCPLLQNYDTCNFFKGKKGQKRKNVVGDIEEVLGSGKELVNPKNIKETTSKLDRLPKQFNMALYKLFDNNINKRMPIWESINGSASISLLRGRGKQFLVIGEIHCNKFENSTDLCLPSDNPTSPRQLLADLARYTPAFLDVYTEHSEFEYWQPQGYLSGFLGKISEGPDDLYIGPGRVGKSRRGMPCMDFQWIRGVGAREAKNAWKMGVCLTSRWHYTDIRELEQSEVDKILGRKVSETGLKYQYDLERSAREKKINVNWKRSNHRFLSRMPSTLEFLVWQGFAGGTGGGNAYQQLVVKPGPYQNKLYKKIGPKLFLAWTKKYLPDKSLDSLIRFKMIYENLDKPYFRPPPFVKSVSYFNIPQESWAKSRFPKEMFVAGSYMPSPLCFELWKLARDTGFKIQGRLEKDTPDTTSLASFIDLIIMYALLQNNHMIEVLKALVKVCNNNQKKSYDRLWDLMFTKSLLGGSPRLKKALNRTTEKPAILTWARSRYDALISKWCGLYDECPEILLSISQQDLAKLGEGIYTNKTATSFNSKFSGTTIWSILRLFRRLGFLFVDLSVINMDCYTIARMFKKFNVPKGVNQPSEPHTCVLYFGDSHSTNVTGFLAQLPGIELIAANNNTSVIKDERPFPAKGGDKKCCLKLDKFPQPLLWPVNTKPGVPLKPAKQKQKKSCYKYKKTVNPKCNDQPGCEWITSVGCMAK